MNAEEKLLVYAAAKEVFEGKSIRQSQPVCCGKKIDLFKTKVYYKDILVGCRQFTLLEPVCLLCGKTKEAHYEIMH